MGKSIVDCFVDLFGYAIIARVITMGYVQVVVVQLLQEKIKKIDLEALLIVPADPGEYLIVPLNVRISPLLVVRNGVDKKNGCR